MAATPAGDHGKSGSRSQSLRLGTPMPDPADTTQATRSPCFVVMPYGLKPFNDGSGRTFDFEKVYRAVIKHTVRGAGLDPRRADHEKTSGIIHIDMFKSLRDNAIVLADLSMENPNVFYELGVRHVMSSKGTVLICREGSILPFDVRLSRVIFIGMMGSASIGRRSNESCLSSRRRCLRRRGAARQPGPRSA